MPTLATLAWIVVCHRPWRVSDEQVRLSGLLRANVRLADWHEPRPGAVRTSSLSLVEQDAEASFLEADGFDARQADGGQTISIDRVTIDARRLDASVIQALDWLDRCEQKSLQLEVAEVVLENRERSLQFVFHGVQLRADSDAKGVWKVQLLASPIVGATTSDGGFRLASEGTAVPAWLLAAAAPMFGDVGNDATFLGVVQLNLVGGELSGAAKGELRGVSLAAALPAGSPCQAEGVATVTIDNLQWRGRQLEGLAGAIRSESVQVNRGLLDAATKHLYCGLVDVGRPLPAAAADMVAIDALACRFEFDRQGLTLWGNFAADANLPQGCLAVSGGAPLLIQPPHTQLPVGYWVQFVAGPSMNWMPATKEAVDLAERLPLPSSVSTPQ